MQVDESAANNAQPIAVTLSNLTSMGLIQCVSNPLAAVRQLT
jgi:hypothetical protein